MKRTCLSLSIALLCCITSMSYADSTHSDMNSEQQQNEQYDDGEASEEAQKKIEGELFRAEVERLYPQYIKTDASDDRYSEFYQDYQSRAMLSRYLERAVHYLKLYQSHINQEQLLPVDPNQSKLDALLHTELNNIYLSLENIQVQLKPVVHFNQVVVDTIRFDQPYPLFVDNDQVSTYEYGLRKLRDVRDEQKTQLLMLTAKVDQYQQKVNQYSLIAPKRIVKRHLENVAVLNRKIELIGHYLATAQSSYDVLQSTYGLLRYYEIEDSPVYAEHFRQVAQSPANLQKVQTLLTAVPNDETEDRPERAPPVSFESVAEMSEYCPQLWGGDSLADIQEYIGERLPSNFVQNCEKERLRIRQFFKQQVFLATVPQPVQQIQHMNAMADYRRYGDDLYYTETEKNALYRFNLKTGTEQLLYQYDLPKDDSGCSHNMCRGVGATDVVLSKDGKIAYVASLDYDQVFAIELSTGTVLHKFKVERYPRKLLLDEKGEYLYVYNGVANSISRINLKNQDIKTVVLPSNYQEHFCREIGMAFEADQQTIRILGDWPNNPYVYLNVKDMQYDQKDFDLPENALHQLDEHRTVVKFYQDSKNPFGIYDRRIAGVVSLIRVLPDASTTVSGLNEEPDYVIRELIDMTRVPKMMGYLGDQYVYYVENPDFEEKFGAIYKALDDSQQTVYILGLIDQTQPNAAPVHIQLPANPNKVELLEDGRIMILFEIDYTDETNMPTSVLVFDPEDVEIQRVFAQNKSKVLGQSVLKVIDLIEPK